MDARIAVVTGANRGIGLEISRQLARKGLKVILTSRSAAKGRAALKALGEGAAGVQYHLLDVTSPVSIKALAAQATVASEFQKLRLDIRGRALMEGAEPVVLIDGRTLNEGDLVTNDLVITAIRSEEIEFIYRGVVLIRPL